MAERPSRIPRSTCSPRAWRLAEAIFWQLQLRAPNGFGWLAGEFGSALAGAAPTTQEPTTIAALISVFVIRTIGSGFGNPRADRFRFAINITTLLLASEGLLQFLPVVEWAGHAFDSAPPQRLSVEAPML